MADYMLPDARLIDEIERSEIAYMTDRMKAIRERTGNPEGVDIREFGGAVAYYSETMPWASFNTVKGLRAGDESLLADIDVFYRERGRRPQFEVVPGLTDNGLTRKLDELGYELAGYHTSLYRDMSEPLVPTKPALQTEGDRGEIAIRMLLGDEIDLYAAIHCRAFGLPEDGIRPVAANNGVLLGRPGWTFWLAAVDGRPAAAGVLHLRDGIASCTFAATLPEFRGKGLQRLLLKRRLEEAAAGGCRLMVGQCAFLSQSHRNMERAGMKIGYVRSAWTARS